ncbi:Undecaprenyl-phosphate galactose phosphotransferase, WbaP/exopolysaccharide biosynthesis polyprenyl glycosylphosphotransferase [Nonomuraea maritima]|uniref:Undecaprenyl-phosphate galactose phosphotransferase, WbaP/exopolysaccharide biosynthesis polyprenyl glycosylphosphotransferase n=1 Tax=Nonomuraea maritima TaxID=683260 RepID=A0A1G9N0B3_9ACTN|nr:sugar transferase [Nonomuraea maritima]SDL79823.1 Undecaprenyl-phosphate galactose phosphotransferase, WbaP/exopolysaccharide biosynthesis polyprenyl glycosylphosphotransferase [Nonomuraea maritima]
MRVGTGESAVVLPKSGLRPASSIWTRAYLRLLLCGDTACVLLACVCVLTVRLVAGVYIPLEEYLLGVGLVAAWPLALMTGGAYRQRANGEGSDEFKAVFNGGVSLMAAVAILAYATQTPIARSFVMAMLPLALLATLFFRHRMRKHLHRRRAVGEYMRQVIAVGHRESILDLVMQFRRQPYHGMEVVGACLPEDALDADLDGVPVLGSFGDVVGVVRREGADAVAVLACPELDGAALRRLAWSLEATRTDLFVAPALLDVAGPRISIRPVAGMPLMHVEHPEFDGMRQFVKTAFDRVVAGAALLGLALPMLMIAAVIRMTSPGPAMFFQTRVGKRGKEFRVVKFRTMVVDAEQLKGALLDANDFDGVLFKIRNDPRITRVGAFLRKYSLDELPQLLNVLRGEMSLVGPRPPLPEEVDQYGGDVRRRLVVKPGITGLWQVSGRSDLTWEESVRLDLRYVENWSLILDLQILWKTWSVVTRGEGAY